MLTIRVGLLARGWRQSPIAASSTGCATRRKAREVALSADHETFAEPAANVHTGTADEVALARAIERLPPDQRQTIRMLKLNEMSLKEAAAASGRSIPALKVATHRAIKSLRRILKQQSNSP